MGLIVDEDMERCCERIRMALAEAGYPDAHVYFEWTGIFVEGVPERVQQRAFDLINDTSQDEQRERVG